MFKLCGEFSIGGSDRPSVLPVANRVVRTDVDHRLNGKTHSGMQTVLISLPIRDMRNVGTLMETRPDTMSDIFVDNSKAIVLRNVGNNRLANHGNLAVGTQRFDRQIQTIERTLRDASGVVADFSDEKSFRLVAEPTIDNCGQVNVHDVARSQLIISGNAVADYFVYADAAAFGKRTSLAGIAQAGWSMSVIIRVFVNQPVKLAGLHSSLNVRANEIHQLGIETACPTHQFPFAFH